MINQPLADRLRPSDFEDIAGQRHLFGVNGVLRKMIDAGRMTNMIFFGPPGTGKTTAANIIAKKSQMQLYRLNATTASLSDVRDAISQTANIFGGGGILLYLDEIQYFNRKQQQSLLEYIEDGRVTLIASTTENPYYYIYNALLSRCSVFEFKPVPPKEGALALGRALGMLNSENGTEKSASADVLEYIAMLGGGDVRRSVGLLENAFYTSDKEITKEAVDGFAPSLPGNFDRAGDVHYDLLSCLQKSIRGSDPDAAVFYLARILSGGDILSACRRLLVIANEDIGAAYPLAASVTYACVESAKALGMPEAAIPLANAAVMLATAPKSNSAYIAYFAAKGDVEAGMGIKIPEHLRSPLFKGYKYPHDYENHYVKQQYLPDDVKGKRYYEFGDNKTEQAAKTYSDIIKNDLKKQ